MKDPVTGIVRACQQAKFNPPFGHHIVGGIPPCYASRLAWVTPRERPPRPHVVPFRGPFPSGEKDRPHVGPLTTASPPAPGSRATSASPLLRTPFCPSRNPPMTPP